MQPFYIVASNHTTPQDAMQMSLLTQFALTTSLGTSAGACYTMPWLTQIPIAQFLEMSSFLDCLFSLSHFSRFFAVYGWQPTELLCSSKTKHLEWIYISFSGDLPGLEIKPIICGSCAMGVFFTTEPPVLFGFLLLQNFNTNILPQDSSRTK